MDSEDSVPFFNVFFNEKPDALSDDEIEKILNNYKNIFVEEYDFWKLLLDKHVNLPYMAMVNKIITTVERPDLEGFLYDKIGYDEFCITFLEKLRANMEKTRAFNEYMILGILNKIVLERINLNLPENEKDIIDQYCEIIERGRPDYDIDKFLS